MASSTRVLLTAGSLLASATLAQAGDRAVFTEPTSEARVDLKPITPPAPAEAETAAAAPVVVPEPTPASDQAHRAHRLKTALRTSGSARIVPLPPERPADAGQDVAGGAPLRPTDQPVEVATAEATFAPSAPAAAPVPAAGPVEAPSPTPAAEAPTSGPREAPAGTVAELVAKHARANGVPLKLAEAVIRIESRGNARAAHAGALGLMQIKYGTARAAGFTGPAVGLFVADTNLRYGMKILGDAYRAAGGDTCGALMRYQSGHLATHMTRANRVYCSHARAIMAAS